MKLISVNVGLPRQIVWHGKPVTTGIFKEPIAGPVQVRQFNVDGDQQADLSVHGGTSKAIYVYPSEHYAFWRAELPGVDWSWGQFGENFTTEGLLEESVYVGDCFSMGEAILRVTQPRMPCYKLNARFQREDMIKRFLLAERSGFYCEVLHEGMVQSPDDITQVGQAEVRVSIAEQYRLSMN